MAVEPALPEKVPALTDLVAARAQACRLLLMSRGIYMLLGGASFVLFGILVLSGIVMVTPSYEPDNSAELTVSAVLSALPFGLLLLACAVVQRWRRARGIGIKKPSELSGHLPGSPELRREKKIRKNFLYFYIVSSIPLVVLPFLVGRELPPLHFFFYYSLYLAVWIACGMLFNMWRSRRTNAWDWDWWILAAGMVATGILIAVFGLHPGAAFGCLAVGIAETVAGIVLELRWIRWVRTTRGLAGEGTRGEVQP